MPTVKVRFPCKNQECDGIIEEVLDVSEPDFSAERMSDGDAIEDHDVCCPECDAEYEVETWSSFGGVTAHVGGDDIDAETRYEPDYDDYLLSYVPASNTEADYISARDDLIELLDDHGGDPDGILNRMIYSQIVAIMEAYLSDKVLRLVTDHQEIKTRVVAGADFIKDQKLSVGEVLADPAKAETQFRLGLQKILYHDLTKVEKIYKVALKNDAFPSDAHTKQVLEDAVKIRHDCVHRNGRNMNGDIHSLPNSMILKLVDAVNSLVQHIESQSANSIQALC